VRDCARDNMGMHLTYENGASRGAPQAARNLIETHKKNVRRSEAVHLPRAVRRVTLPNG